MSLVSELNKALKNKGKRRSKYLFPIKDSTFRNKDLIEGIKVIISKNVTMSKVTKKFEKVTPLQDLVLLKKLYLARDANGEKPLYYGIVK